MLEYIFLIYARLYYDSTPIFRGLHKDPLSISDIFWVVKIEYVVFLNTKQH